MTLATVLAILLARLLVIPLESFLQSFLRCLSRGLACRRIVDNPLESPEHRGGDPSSSLLDPRDRALFHGDRLFYQRRSARQSGERTGTDGLPPSFVCTFPAAAELACGSEHGGAS